MNLDQALFLAYVEEDNTQRAYFRVHPILTVEGSAAEEGHRLWPDDGCLRIVPDRGEQHTFKDRMRQLNGWCVVDLTAFMPEANKIRTNKNYHPDRGESNRFILYSDAVHSVPTDVFHEVFAGKAEDAAALAAAAVTPTFFIRDEETVYGPVSRENPVVPDVSAPMEALYCSVSCPDGKNRDFLCVQAEYDARPKQEPVLRMPRKRDQQPETPAEAPAQPADSTAPVPQAAVPQPETKPEAQPEVKPEAKPEVQPDAQPQPAGQEAVKPQPAEDEPLKVGQPLQILDANHTFEETLDRLNAPVSGQANLLSTGNTMQAAPVVPAQNPTRLGGTPLAKGPAQSITAQPRNKTQEAVYNQVRVVRNEPPALDLPRNAQLKPADNPVEAAEQALRRAWSVADARDRVLESFLAMDGVEPVLERRVSRKIGITDLQNAIHAHISTLEAERIRVLVDLDKAKANLDEYQQSVIAAARKKTVNELNALDEKKQALEANIAALKDELNALVAEHEVLLKKVTALQKDTIPEAVARVLAENMPGIPTAEEPLRLVPVSGEALDAEGLLVRISKACKGSGVPYNRNHALAGLLAMAVSGRVGVTGPAPAAQVTFMRNLAAMMGWENSFAVQESGQRPMISAAPVDSTPAVLVSAMPNYAFSPRFTRIILSPAAFTQANSNAYCMNQWPVLPLELRNYVPVYRENGVKPVSMESIRKLTEAGELADAEIAKALAPVLALTAPLSGEAMKALYSFIRSGASLMEGGLAAACDWGIRLWILPSLDAKARASEQVKLALTEYPMCSGLVG